MKKIFSLFWLLFSLNLFCNTLQYLNENSSYLSGINRNAEYSFFSQQSIIIFGTNSNDEDENDLNEMLAYNVIDFRIKRWLSKSDNVVDILVDHEVTVSHLQKYNLILVGTSSSNSILKELSAFLPVTINENEIIFADQTFSGDETGIIYRYPNPANPKRQLWIISAPNYEALRFIPQPYDYCVYQITDYNPMADRFLELALGDFNENWQLASVALVDNEVIDSGEDNIPDYEPPDFFSPPSWVQDGVMYEIFVRSFADSDGDGIGDLPGLIGKLDYLNDGNPMTDSDLGIKTIWLMPVFKSPSYHGYDVTDYYNINPDYGTNEDFQQLLQEAHKRGIRIVTDLILNHCSNQHPFFLDAYNNPDSDFDDWFFFTNPSNTRAHNWQFRHRPTDREMLNPYMPAWNVNNPKVQDYLIEMAKYWIDPDGDGDFSDGIDGFRCDYVKGPPPEFWKKFRFEIKSLNPEVLLLAENWDGMTSIAESFDDQFDMAFDFPFQGSVMEAVSSGIASPLIRLLNEQNSILPEFAVMNRFVNNHDMNRIFTRLDDKSAKLALAILLSLPDMPMLYYGDEIGMQGEKDPYDEGIRRPMEWCADNDCSEMTTWYPVWNHLPDGISVEEQENDPLSILNYTKTLIRNRQNYPVLESGEIITLPVFEKVENELSGSRRGFACLVQNKNQKILLISSLREDRKLFLQNFISSPSEFFPLLGNSQVKYNGDFLEIICHDKEMNQFLIQESEE